MALQMDASVLLQANLQANRRAAAEAASIAADQAGEMQGSQGRRRAAAGDLFDGAAVAAAAAGGSRWCRCELVPNGDEAAELAVEGLDSYTCCPALWAAVAAPGGRHHPLLAALLLRAAAHVSCVEVVQGPGQLASEVTAAAAGAALQLPSLEGSSDQWPAAQAAAQVAVVDAPRWLLQQLLGAAGENTH
jgi:hypothetical protein